MINSETINFNQALDNIKKLTPKDIDALDRDTVNRRLGVADTFSAQLRKVCQLQIALLESRLKLLASQQQSTSIIEPQRNNLRNKTNNLKNKKNDLIAKTDDFRNKTNKLRNKNNKFRNKTDDMRTKTHELRTQTNNLGIKTHDLRTQARDLRTKTHDLTTKTNDIRKPQKYSKVPFISKVNSFLGYCFPAFHQQSHLHQVGKPKMNQDTKDYLLQEQQQGLLAHSGQYYSSLKYTKHAKLE